MASGVATEVQGLLIYVLILVIHHSVLHVIVPATINLAKVS